MIGQKVTDRKGPFVSLQIQFKKELTDDDKVHEVKLFFREGKRFVFRKHWFVDTHALAEEKRKQLMNRHIFDDIEIYIKEHEL